MYSFIAHLVVDGGPKQDENEAERHHRQNTEEGSQEDGQPHVRLVKRVSCSAWSPKNIRAGVRITQTVVTFGF